MRAVAGRAGLAVVMWSLDPRDSKRITPQVIEHVSSTAYARGDIVVLHDRYARTPTALPLILTVLAGRGYTFVTVPQLFAGSEGARPGVVYHHGPRILIPPHPQRRPSRTGSLRYDYVTPVGSAA
ncbi:hypothetical protein ACF09I_31445 [Streptomyces sp. NPDC014940]|uniref:hypothetical protein n=1 Tax=Streptomyces sp. NPDC014940 TaxID=3364932 RepID=UPI0036F5D0D1